MHSYQKSHCSDDHTAVGKTLPVGFKRLFFLLLVLSCTFLASACTSQPSPTAAASSPTRELTPTSTTKPATPTPTPTITPQPTSSLGVNAANLDGTILELWHPWSGETARVIQESLTEFNTSNEFGITVEAISQNSLNSLYEKVDTAELESGLPNITIGPNYQIRDWISSGEPVMGLKTYINDPEWGFSSQELADFNEIFLLQDVKGENQFAMPAVRTAQVMYYNTTWAEELGFPSPPDTPDEFKTQVCAAAQTFQTDDNLLTPGTGGWLINTSPSAILSWLYAFDSSILLPDDTGYHFNSPETEQAFLFLKELIDQGCAYEVLESPAEVNFANRRALIITSPLSNIGYQNAEFERAENNDKWTVIGFPSIEGKPGISVYGPSYAVFSGTPEENLASWLVLKWLLSPKSGATFTEAHGTFPVRESMLKYLDDYASGHPQWSTAQALLTNARPEPGLKSWDKVRWILGDVGTQIFRYYFTPDRIPATLELMDETAAELHEFND